MINISIPESLADPLIKKGYARRSGMQRGTFSEWLIVGANEASVWITLLQTPAVLEYYAGLLIGRSKKEGGRIEVSVDSPSISKHLTFEVNSDVEVDKLVDALGKLLGD